MSEQQIAHQVKRQYIRNRILGAGSYGQAVLVSLAGTNKQFVIKEVALQKMKSKDRNDVLKEAYIMSRLNHPNIVHYEETFVSKDVLCMVMEFANYGDLAKQIKYRARASSLNAADKKYFTEDQILDMLTQLCLSVKYMHDRNILHRDIKSQNLLLSVNPCFSPEDNVSWADEETFCYTNSQSYNAEITKIIQEKRYSDLEQNQIFLQHCQEKWNKAPRLLLCDFGVSRLLDRTMDAAMTSVGTPYYISPEIIGGKSYGKASDMYSVGVVLFEMMNLRYPFEASNIQALAMAIMKNNYVIDTESLYSAELVRVLRCLLDVHEENRPSAKTLLEHPLLRCRLPQFISKQRFAQEFPQIQYALINKCPIPVEQSKRAIAEKAAADDISSFAKEYKEIVHCISSATEMKSRAIYEGSDPVAAQKAYNLQMKQALKQLNSKDPHILQKIDNEVVKRYIKRYSVDLGVSTPEQNQYGDNNENENENVAADEQCSNNRRQNSNTSSNDENEYEYPGAPKQTELKLPISKIHGEISIENQQSELYIEQATPKSSTVENNELAGEGADKAANDKPDVKCVTNIKAKTEINLNSEHVAHSNFKAAFESFNNEQNPSTNYQNLLPVNISSDGRNLISDKDILAVLGGEDRGVIELVKVVQQIDKVVYHLRQRMGDENYTKVYNKAKQLSKSATNKEKLLEIIKAQLSDIGAVYQKAFFHVCVLENEFVNLKDSLIERVNIKMQSNNPGLYRVSSKINNTS